MTDKANPLALYHQRQIENQATPVHLIGSDPLNIQTDSVIIEQGGATEVTLEAVEARLEAVESLLSGTLTAQLSGSTADSLKNRGGGVKRYYVNNQDVPASGVLDPINTAAACIIEHLEIVHGSRSSMRLQFQPRDEEGNTETYYPLNVASGGTAPATAANILTHGGGLWQPIHSDEALNQYKFELRTPFALPTGFRLRIENISQAPLPVSVMALVRLL